VRRANADPTDFVSSAYDLFDLVFLGQKRPERFTAALSRSNSSISSLPIFETPDVHQQHEARRQGLATLRGTALEQTLPFFPHDGKGALAIAIARKVSNQ